MHTCGDLFAVASLSVNIISRQPSKAAATLEIHLASLEKQNTTDMSLL